MKRYTVWRLETYSVLAATESEAIEKVDDCDEPLSVDYDVEEDEEDQ